jgi:hypothetical protein
LLHFRFGLFNPTHTRHRRTPVYPASQHIQLFVCANRVSLDTAVIQIPHPPGQTNGSRLLGDEITKTDALNPPGYQPASGRLPMFPGGTLFQWICSEFAAAFAADPGTDSIAFFTAAHRLCS